MKLGKLPDRNPVRITFVATPDQNRALSDYAEYYKATYDETAAVPDLVPMMLEALMNGDPGFARFRKAGAAKPGGEK